LVSAGVLWAVLVGPTQAWGSDPVIEYYDHADLANMKIAYPKGAELFAQGEAALLAGKHEQAAELMSKAAALAPDSALASRRQCEALTVLGRKSEALRACGEAMLRKRNPAGSLASVRALVSGESPPTSAELDRAMLLAATLETMDPARPWSHAARCEIAEAIGDHDLLLACLGGLKRTAPGSPETERALLAARAYRPGWFFWAGWGAILAMVLGTLLHAGVAALGRYWNGRTLGSALVCALLFSTWALSVRAEGSQGGEPLPGQLSQWPINEADPVSSLPSEVERNKSPLQFGYLIMDLIDGGETAIKKKDFGTAAKYYRAVAKAVPEKSVSWSKLCLAYRELGDRPNSLETCRTAVAREGSTVEDYSNLANLLLAKNGELTLDEVEDLDAIIGHLQKELPKNSSADEIACGLGAKLHDLQRLERCTENLVRLAPDQPKTVSALFAYALERGDRGQAKELILKAQASEMPPEMVRKMAAALEAKQPLWLRGLRNPWGIAALLLAVAAAIAAGFGLRRREQPAAT
jgi:tetratricopeptide (TPR) repeat protein